MESKERAQQIEERLKGTRPETWHREAFHWSKKDADFLAYAHPDITWLLEDRKRLIGEVKRIESYCTEVEIARRVAESEVASLKAQIAAVETLLASADGSGRVLLRDVRAALGAGEGERT